MYETPTLLISNIVHFNTIGPRFRGVVQLDIIVMRWEVECAYLISLRIGLGSDHRKKHDIIVLCEIVEPYIY